MQESSEKDLPQQSARRSAKLEMRLAIGLAGAAATLAIDAPKAQSHRRDFPFTYDWYQPVKGEKELELKSRYRGRDASFQQQIEFEYGVSDRLVIAPYVVFERGRGENLRYAEVKLESRYQLGKFKTNRILPSLYLEYARPRSGAGELEGKLILSRFNKKGDNLSLNLIAERELASGAEIEREYSIGYARDLGRKGARIGAEWIHNLTDKRINAGPTIAFSATKDIWLVTGYAFPISGRGNRGEFRLLLEYEWS